MADIMKGNFVLKKKVSTEEKEKESLEARFEREAMRRIGGSIAFVSRQKVKWDFKEKGEEPKNS